MVFGREWEERHGAWWTVECQGLHDAVELVFYNDC